MNKVITCILKQLFKNKKKKELYTFWNLAQHKAIHPAKKIYKIKVAGFTTP